MKTIYFSIIVFCYISILSCTKENNCELFNIYMLQEKAFEVDQARLAFISDPVPAKCGQYKAIKDKFDETIQEYLDISSDCENIPADTVLLIFEDVDNQFGIDAVQAMIPYQEDALEAYLVYVDNMTIENCQMARSAYQAMLDRANLLNECEESETLEDLIKSIQNALNFLQC